MFLHHSTILLSIQFLSIFHNLYSRIEIIICKRIWFLKVIFKWLSLLILHFYFEIYLYLDFKWCHYLLFEGFLRCFIRINLLWFSKLLLLFRTRNNIGFPIMGLCFYSSIFFILLPTFPSKISIIFLFQQFRSIISSL